jgi:hypothetical protein
MPWVTFTAPFCFKVKIKPHVVIAYKAGCSYLVKQECADLAIKSGKAVATDRPEKAIRDAGR